MASATGMNFALGILRLRGHPSQEATETLLKVLYYSFRSIQVKYHIGMATASWVKADKGQRKVDMCTKNNIPSESMYTAMRTSPHTVKRIDMNPTPKPKPRRKENPYAPEIPEQTPLPGMPVPAFPDVAIPFVPELPTPEVPEIPMPQEPGKAPKKKPSPGEPFPDSQKLCSSQVTQLETPMVYPLRHKETADISVFHCNIIKSKKYIIPDEFMTPLMMMAMILSNRNHDMRQSKINNSNNNMLSITPQLNPTQIVDILSILKYQEKIETLPYRSCDLGMTYEQYKQLYEYVSRLQSHVQRPELLVNRFIYVHKRRNL